MKIAILGLGEAGSRFANDLCSAGVTVTGWDPAPRYPLAANFTFATSNADAAHQADVVLSVNLPAVSEVIAAEVKDALQPGCYYCCMNTSAPEQKRRIESLFAETRISMIDLAIMAPVPPQGISTPILASGPNARPLARRLASYMNIEVLNEQVGDAAGRKLLRSIVYKGVAAVVCEAMEAAEKLQLTPYMRTQINSILGDNDALIERFIQGSKTHAGRRIHEMEAVSQMLQDIDASTLMSDAAALNLARYL